MSRGIFRVYLQQVHPYLRVYVSPVNIDPEDPALPISTPRDYSRSLAGAVGPFYTQGHRRGNLRLPCRHSLQGRVPGAEPQSAGRQPEAVSLRTRPLPGRPASSITSPASIRTRTCSGAATTTTCSRSTARWISAIGQAMAKAGTDTPLLVISDHGFAPFNRAVHLNSFLMREGFLALDDPAKTGDEELFAHVDWSKTAGLRDRSQRRVREPGRPGRRRRGAGSRQAAGAGTDWPGDWWSSRIRQPAKGSSSGCTSRKRRSAAGI